MIRYKMMQYLKVYLWSNASESGATHPWKYCLPNGFHFSTIDNRYKRPSIVVVHDGWRFNVILSEWLVHIFIGPYKSVSNRRIGTAQYPCQIIPIIFGENKHICGHWSDQCNNGKRCLWWFFDFLYEKIIDENLEDSRQFRRGNFAIHATPVGFELDDNLNGQLKHPLWGEIKHLTGYQYTLSAPSRKTCDIYWWCRPGEQRGVTEGHGQSGRREMW